MVPVAVILPTAEVGGHEALLMRWLSSAREYGLEPTIFCRRSPELMELVGKSGLPWVAVDYSGQDRGARHSSRWRNFIRTWKTAARVPNGAPVVLAPGAMQLAILQILACRLARRPIVCYVPMTHDAATMGMRLPALRDWLTARLASSVRLWITSSERQSRRLSSFWRVRAPIHLVPTRLSILSQPPRRRDAATKGDSRLNLLYLGRFSAFQKGLDWLASLLEAEPRWTAGYTFTFQGRGSFHDRLEALARQLGPERVRVVPWGDTAETLATADVLILTSRYEGFPLVAVEAIWAGVPIVATAESGLEDVLPAACLYPFGDAARFELALERMREPANREDAVTRARERLEAQLSDERYRQSLRRVLAALAALR